MSLVMQVIKICGCKEPIPNFRFSEPKCPVCGKKERILAVITCGKCGHVITDEKYRCQAKGQEVRHQHSDAELRATVGKLRKKRKFLEP